MEKLLEIGDTIEITNAGSVCSSARDIFISLEGDLNKFQMDRGGFSGHLKNNMIGRLLNVKTLSRPSGERRYYLIEMGDNYQYVMCGGIVSCSKKFKEIKEYGIVSFMRTKA